MWPFKNADSASTGPSLEIRFIRMSGRALFVAAIGIVLACYIFDIIFFGDWAPNIWLWPVFVVIGLGLRTIAIFGGVFLAEIEKEGGGAARMVVRVVQVLCFLVCTLATLNFFAVAPESRKTTVDQATNLAETGAALKDVRIADLEAEIAKIEADLDKAIDGKRQTIATIIGDPVPGVGNEDNATIRAIEKEITEISEAASMKVDERQKAIADIREARDADKMNAETQSIKLSDWPIFSWLSDRTPVPQSAWTDGTMVYITLTIESIATWLTASLITLYRVFGIVLVRKEIEDEKRRAEEKAEGEASRIKAQAHIDKVRRDALFEAQRDEAKNRIDDAKRQAELQAANIEGAAHTEVIRREAERRAVEMLGDNRPERPDYSPSQSNGAHGRAASDFYKDSDQGRPKIPVNDERAAA